MQPRLLLLAAALILPVSAAAAVAGGRDLTRADGDGKVLAKKQEPDALAGQGGAGDGAEKNEAGYLVAASAREWAFPRDFGRHDGFKTEWWYFTGNLVAGAEIGDGDRNKVGAAGVTGAGRKFGFQLTFFRTALAPEAAARPSGWGTGDLYFAHLAVTDVDGKRFVFKDRMQRGRAGVAESSAATLDVSLLDWCAKLQPVEAAAEGASAAGTGAVGPGAGAAIVRTRALGEREIVLRASEANFGIDLRCRGGVGPVLQGPGGVNAKGRERGRASYYYSVPRLETVGTIELAGERFGVRGLSWMDHEFSSNALAAGQVGWDWFALTLADGRDVMIYRLRNKDGGSDYLSGTVIDSSGKPRYLTEREIKLEGSAPWRSQSGGNYPQVWALEVAGMPALTVRSRMPGQELRTEDSTKVDYFEGTCEVRGADGAVVGEGYMELTGYAKAIEQP